MFNWFWDFLYSIQKSIQLIIDFIVNTFRVLAGLTPVKVPGETEEGVDILGYFLSAKAIRQAFFLIVMIAIVLLFIFCFIATIRRQYAENEQRSIGAIVGTALKSALMFLLIPIIFLAANTLLIATVRQLDLATNPGRGKLLTKKTRYYDQIIKEEGAQDELTGYTQISIGRHVYRHYLYRHRDPK